MEWLIGKIAGFNRWWTDWVFSILVLLVRQMTYWMSILLRDTFGITWDPGSVVNDLNWALSRAKEWDYIVPVLTMANMWAATYAIVVGIRAFYWMMRVYRLARSG